MKRGKDKVKINILKVPRDFKLLKELEKRYNFEWKDNRRGKNKLEKKVFMILTVELRGCGRGKGSKSKAGESRACRTIGTGIVKAM